MSHFARSRSIDFVAFCTFYAVGFFDMFIIPMHAREIGEIKFLGCYLAVLIIFGIPAFTEEFAYFMPSKNVQHSASQKKFQRSYEIIGLIVITQITISEAHNKLRVAITQFFNLFGGSHSADTLALYSSNCHTHSRLRHHTNDSLSVVTSLIVADSDSNLLDDEERLIMPPCMTRSRSELACIFHGLFSDPQSILMYTTWALSITVVVYTAIFGRSLQTYGAIGKVYTALMVLCVMTLMLHFVGQERKAASHDLHSVFTFENLLTHVLSLCIPSLGLLTFSISSLGSTATKPIKENFVFLAIIIASLDTAVAFAFSGVNYLRYRAVHCLCHGINTEAFMSLPDVTENMLNSSRFRLSEASIRGTLMMSESVLLFRETSGFVPWTVYMPFQVLIMMFSILLACVHMLLSDFLAIRVFKKRNWLVVVLAVFRLGGLVGMSFLRLDDQVRFLEDYTWKSNPLAFTLVKLLQCFVIHRNQGFPQYIEDRRRLLPENNKVQRFLFNWYIAPTSVFLYNFGYPVLFLILVLHNRETVLTIGFCAYFLLFNALPITIVIATVYCGRDATTNLHGRQQ